MGKPKQRKRAPKEKAPRGGVGEDDAPADSSKNSRVGLMNGNGGSHQKHHPAYTNSNDSDPSIPSLLIYLIKVLFLTSLSVPFWFLTGFLSIVYGRPPKLVYPSQTWRFLRYTIESTEPTLTYPARLDLIMTILLHTATSPVSGFFWLLDEILYGSRLNSLTVEKPLFVLSAYRSASTEMARTLAKDTQRFVAPNAIMCAFPYLWLWNLITWIVGEDSGISTKEANGYLNKNFSKESLERHDNDHFSIDTFDGYFLSSHLNGLAFRLGPEVMWKEFNCARFEEHDRYLFEHCFVEHVDRIARKTFLFNGNSTAASTSSSKHDDRTFLLKGHFLLSAHALQRKYPDARFLAVLRDPLDRLKSCINHSAVNPTLWHGKHPRWDWLAEAFPRIEVEYCGREVEWYENCGDDKEKRRMVVKFDSFVKDFAKTMRRVYRDLLECDDDDQVPKFALPSKHTKRYTVDRSLNELGVDEAGLKRHLGDYYAWMKKQ